MSELEFPLGGGSVPSFAAAAYKRMMLALLPPGRLWRLIGDSFLLKLIAGCAEEIARVDARAIDLRYEANASTACELLSEYEEELGLASTGTTDERQARVLAKEIARQRFRPVDIQNALAPLLGLAPEDVEVIEITNAAAVASGDERRVYRFSVYRDPGLPGTYYVESAQALLDEISHSHTKGHVIESVDFRCDDPHSLCDRDVLGA